MCVIVHVPQGGFLPESILKQMYTHNPDGCGIVSAGGMQKGLWSYPELREIVYSIPEGDEFLLHLRIATHGGITQDNCHPFPLREGSWIMHNGILDLPIVKSGWSDTRTFARMLRSYTEDEIANSVEEIERWHAFGNRLAFWLPNYGVITTGFWAEEDTFSASNSYWKPCKKKPSAGKGNKSIYDSNWNDHYYLGDGK